MNAHLIKTHFRSSWADAMVAFTEVTKHDEAIGIETVLWYRQDSANGKTQDTSVFQSFIGHMTCHSQSESGQIHTYYRCVICWSSTLHRHRSVELEKVSPKINWFQTIILDKRAQSCFIRIEFDIGTVTACFLQSLS